MWLLFSSKSIDELAAFSGRIQSFELGPPNIYERIQFLKLQLASITNTLNEREFTILGFLTVGLNFRSLEKLVERSIACRSELTECTRHFIKVLHPVYYLPILNGDVIILFFPFLQIQDIQRLVPSSPTQKCRSPEKLIEIDDFENIKTAIIKPPLMINHAIGAMYAFITDEMNAKKLQKEAQQKTGTCFRRRIKNVPDSNRRYTEY